MNDIEAAINELKETCQANADQNDRNLRRILTELQELKGTINGIAQDVRRIKTNVQSR